MSTKQPSNPIRAARKSAKLTQQALGKKLGVKKASISGWETGRYRPEPDKALRLISILPALTMQAIYATQRKAA